MTVCWNGSLGHQLHSISSKVDYDRLLRNTMQDIDTQELL